MEAAEEIKDAVEAVEENAEAQKEKAVAEAAAIAVAASSGAVELAKQTSAEANLTAAKIVQEEQTEWQKVNQKAETALAIAQDFQNQVNPLSERIASLTAAHQKTLEAMALLTPPPSPEALTPLNPAEEEVAQEKTISEQNQNEQKQVARKTRKWI